MRINGPLEEQDINAQFCSDWLKGEIRRIISEKRTLSARVKVLEEAMERAQTHRVFCRMDGTDDGCVACVALRSSRSLGAQDSKELGT